MALYPRGVLCVQSRCERSVKVGVNYIGLYKGQCYRAAIGRVITGKPESTHTFETLLQCGGRCERNTPLVGYFFGLLGGISIAAG